MTHPSIRATGAASSPRPETDPPGAPDPELVLAVNDRPGALERLFGTIRRRRMDLRVVSLGRCDDGLVLVFRRDLREAVPDRWLAELEGLVDVHQVRVSISRPLPPDGGPPPHTDP